ncbi:MAG: YigZ family protein [Firmicutes bacterium]|nr:YigZ family protein [Bacillota bacterium]
MVDVYRSPAQEAEVEIKIERSRFIGWVRPVDSEQKAKILIANRSEQHHQATHNAWAYRIDPRRDTRFASDAGEPTGTAGEPIMRAILSFELTDVLVVVTRYYGGKKLGIRGLIDAYGQAASQALAAAGIAAKLIAETFRITISYPELDRCLHLLKTIGGQVLAADYKEQVTLKVAVPQSKAASFATQVQHIARIENWS